MMTPDLPPTSDAAVSNSASSSSAKKAGSEKKYPSDFQIKMLWAAVTAASFAIIAWVVAKSVGVVGSTLHLLQPVLVPLAAAGILAYLLEPLIRKLAAKAKMSRYRAMIIVFAAFHVLMLFIGLSVAVPTLGHVSNLASAQARGTLVKNLERSLDSALGPLEKYFSSHADEKAREAQVATVPTVPGAAGAEAVIVTKESWWKVWLRDEDHSAKVVGKAKDWLLPIFSGFLGMFGYIVGLVMVPLYLYYFLKDADGIAKHWTEYLPLRASGFKDEVVEVLTEVNGYLMVFFRGAMLVSIIDGVLVAIFLLLIGLPYATLIGLCVALFGLLPYVGHLLCWLAALAVTMVHFGEPLNRFDWMPAGWAYPVVVTVVFGLVMKINALFTAPRIIGDAVGLHPMTVIFSVLFWSLLLGPLLGALLAVPMSAAVKVLFRRYIWQNWTKRQIVSALL